jgi:predicted PurR-regulated permease PerM
MNSPELQRNTFLLLLITISIAFGWVLLPFYGAVFWASVLAILFAPFYQRLLTAMGQRRNLAAFTTLMLCLIVVILPLAVIAGALLMEGDTYYQKISSRELDFGIYFQQVISALPSWMVDMLERIGITNLASLKDRLSDGAVQASQFIASHALSIGQNTFHLMISFGIMLYLLFFFLRDGAALATKIKHAIPLSLEQKLQLFTKFTTVIRATVKGNIVVAAAQGALGGIIFWLLGIQGALLWGTVMAFLSLLPAVGAAIIWVPVAIYFLLTGAVWQGVTLIAAGVFAIGTIDNILRPILVGKDTQMPDYVVLISTVGGIAIFGINGFVIGPAIAAMFIAAWDLFSSSKDAHERLSK